MIGKLKGIVDTIEMDHTIIDVGGVGYIAYCSGRTLQSLPQVGGNTNLIIETQVREDSITLYGFTNTKERDWFKLLITVKGVGPRMALAILSSLNSEQLGSALLVADKAIFIAISGVGPKLADRILVELKDKSVGGGITIGQKQGRGEVLDNNALNDAISALSNLGYGRSESYNVVSNVLSKDVEIQVGELIKLSLKELAR